MLLSIFAVQMLVKLRNKGHNFEVASSGGLRVVGQGENGWDHCPLYQALLDDKKVTAGVLADYPTPAEEDVERVSLALSITPKDALAIMYAADNPNTPDGITLRSILCPSSSPLALKVAAQIPTSGYADRHKGVELVY